MNAFQKFRLDVAGLGLIFYSPFSAAAIQEGEDYLERGFSDPDVVEKQALEGRLVGVSTGTPGRFYLEVFQGYPDDAELEKYAYRLRLGVEVRDRTLCVRDLYDLLKWQSKCPATQVIALTDGFYHVTLLSNDPQSGILGEDQIILVYLQQLPEMPKLKYNGVPTLC
ncbi:MAG: hypothetical protein Q7T36_05365 [Fluviicoccus sp.]|uniref:hypothetical protein n=1 Tax=Fluviicoccus sp. TaxID=2003552 RepID=UPI0027162017|nr:hypothetical protein [Fluviicoccus sp.]MDO8329884.1 hypothetical protein [Fluviicoccus sp.]